MILFWPGLCHGQAAESARPSAPPPDADSEIVVTARHGEVVTALQPLATFDASAIGATGATSIGEFLQSVRGATQSADGQDPIFLLNGQRVSGYAEIGSLPPEAIEKVEVLPEPVALRYGYPPTRRVVNFITKRRFRQVALKPGIGTATDGGASSASGHADLTRLHGDGRLTLALDAQHTDALRQSRRTVRPDPDVPFDAIGNVTGLGGGPIDPALSGLAGTPVTIAPVPHGAPTLAGFAAGANQPRRFDPSPFRDLAQASDTLHGETVIAGRIGGTLAASLTLTAEHKRERGLLGPANATLAVPAGNPFSPFASTVLLNRYLVEAAPLRQRNEATTLHAGGLLRGAWRGWQWDLTGTIDRQRRISDMERAIDLAPAKAAIAAGADPFVPLAPALVANRLADHSVQVTSGAGAKLLASNQPFALPAGKATFTATAEVERTDSEGRTRGFSQYATAFGRSRVEGQVALDLPLASRSRNVLPWLGDLSINGSLALRSVGGFGTLFDSTAGLSWTPIAGVQFLVQRKRSEAAPTPEQLATPLAVTPQVSIFDFATGRATLVTLRVGGNPALAAERRTVQSVGVSLKPLASSALRIAASYEWTAIANGIDTVYTRSRATQAALPDLFVAGPDGALDSIAYRPINLYRERRQALVLTLNGYGMIGRTHPAPGPGKKPPPRANVYGGIGPTLLIEDRVTLRPGTAPLDLLAGDTLSSWVKPRLAGYGYGGVGYRGSSAAFDFYCTGSARIQGGVAASTLAFAPMCKINGSVTLNPHALFLRQGWSRNLTFKLETANLTNTRQRVRAADGSIPYRYQRDLLDPIGRTVRLSLRKRF